MQTTENKTDTLIPTFEHRSVLPTTLDALMAFHADSKAFQRLTPPPIFVQVHRREMRSLTDGEVEFTLWFLFFPVRWIVRHEPGETSHSFTDRMVAGPVEVWVHRHIFEETVGGAALIDRLTIQHKKSGFWALFSRLFFGTIPLRFLFVYRHLRTRLGVKQYEQREGIG